MRKITEQAIEAVYNKSNFKRSNTVVFYSDAQETSYLTLFDNTIAIYSHFNDSLQISSCGWKTATTKERLNGLKNVSIRKTKGEWFLNDKNWDGSLTTIK